MFACLVRLPGLKVYHLEKTNKQQILRCFMGEAAWCGERTRWSRMQNLHSPLFSLFLAQRLALHFPEFGSLVLSGDGNTNCWVAGSFW